MSASYAALACACLILLGACRSSPQHEPEISPIFPASEVLNEDATYPIDVYDPLEGLNRRLYTFNYYFDKFVFLPIVNVYDFVAPDLLQKGITNVFENVYEVRNFANTLFQLKGKVAFRTLGRFLVNTTVGIGGLWDPATRMGLHRQVEDFGQTLGHYGTGNGPYLILPILGPSNLRDGVGSMLDAALILPLWLLTGDYSSVVGGTLTVSSRNNVAFRYYETDSPFEYELVRFLYTKKRELEIIK
ncbi:MAG: VacJ family lipoprotein [Planctomycetota bacterium]